MRFQFIPNRARFCSLILAATVFCGPWPADAKAAADAPPPSFTPGQQARLKACDERSDKALELVANGDFKRAIAALEINVAVKREILGNSDKDTFYSMQWLARILALQGHPDEATSWAEQAVEVQSKARAADHWLVREARRTRDDVRHWSELSLEHRLGLRMAEQLGSLADSLAAKGESQAALKAALEALEIRKAELGAEHPDTLSSENGIGSYHRELKDFNRAESILRRALETRRKLLGDDHPDVGQSCNSLAWTLLGKGNHAEAESLFRQAAEIYRRAEGTWSSDYADTLDNLAELYVRNRQYRRAAALREELVEIRKRVNGEGHIDYATALEQLAYAYQYLEEYDKAEPLARKALAIFRKNLGAENSRTINSLRDLAYILSKRDRPEESIALNLEAIDLLKKAAHPDHAAIGNSLSQIRSIYYSRRNCFKALEFQRRATEAFRNASGDKGENYLEGLKIEATLLDQCGYEEQKHEHFDAARRLYQEQLKLLSKLYGPDFWSAVNARLALAYVDQLEKMTASQRQEVAQADELAQKAGESMQAKPQEALALVEKALAIYSRILGEENFKTIGLTADLAYLYKELGNPAKARAIRETLPERMLKLKGERHPDYAGALHNLGHLYESAADYRRALEIYERAAGAWQESYGAKSDPMANTLNSMAFCHDSLGDYQEAERLYRQALDMRRELSGPRDIGYAHSMLNLGGFYMWSIGDYPKARPLLEQAVEIYQTKLGEMHPYYAFGIDSLASYYVNTQQLERAEALYLQALKIRRQTVGEKNPQCKITLDNLAPLYADRGQYDKAVALLQEALEIGEATYGKVHPSNASTLRKLGNAYRDSGQLEQAEAAFKQAAEVFKQSLGTTGTGYAENISLLAVVYALGDHPERGVQPALEALDIARQQLNRMGSIESERRQLALRAKLWQFINNYLFVTARAGVDPDKVFAQVLNWKGIVGASQQQLRSLYRRMAGSGNQQIVALVAELESTTRSLAEQSRGGSAQDRERHFRLAELSDKVERLQQQLAGMSTEFNQRQQQSRRTPDDIRKVLPENAVLVDFLVYAHPQLKSASARTSGAVSGLVAFVVRPNRPTQRIEFGPSEPVSAAITAWRTNYGMKLESLDPGQELRRLLWKPLEPHVAGAQMLLVSPNGTLAPLPWAALPGREPGHYLIDEIAIGMVPIVQLLPDLLAEKPRSAENNPSPSLLVVGDVDFGAAVGKLELAAAGQHAVRGSQSLEWSALPGTRDEIAAVEASFEKRFPSTGVVELAQARATKAALLNEAGRHEYVHISTHGFFAPPEVQSALRMNSASDGSGATQQNVSGFHPGLLSGLVLAGANRADHDDSDDGILTALEVEELDLSRVQLATLSACETGLGQTAGGEGLLGLQRAFQTAGAHSVVASLWKVPDVATQALMSRFYANLWQKKLSKLEALREAQQWMIREGNKLPGAMRGLRVLNETEQPALAGQMPPYFWAAFVLSGDWR